MGREVRRVPMGWKHPDDQPLLSGPFSERLKEWNKGNEMWRDGFVKSWENYPETGWKTKPDDVHDETYKEYAGGKPAKEDYMPEWTEYEKTHYQMYETCTEGLPISPVMETPEELARWLTDNDASAFGNQTASYDGWLKVARGDSAPSAVLTIGEGIESGVEALKGN